MAERQKVKMIFKVHMEILKFNFNHYSLYVAYFVLKKANRIFLNLKENVNLLNHYNALKTNEEKEGKQLINFQKLMQIRNDEEKCLF